jgi:hypothetical protein
MTTLYYDRNGHLFSMSRINQTYYVATDHAGTPTHVFDVAGRLVKEITRTPFGLILLDTNLDLWVPIGYQGGNLVFMKIMNFFSRN